MGFSEYGGYLNIMMEYCENGSLNNVRKRFGKFPESLGKIIILFYKHALKTKSMHL
jgi:hypothetical protein